MKLTRVEPGTRIGAGRGEPFVCVHQVPGARLSDCLVRLAAHTPAEIPIAVIGELDGVIRDPDGVIGELDGVIGELDGVIGELEPDDGPVGPRALYQLAPSPGTVGAEGALAAAARIADPADVVLLPSSCAVAEGWLEGLRSAAYSDSRVATATPLSAPPSGSSLEPAAARVSAASLRLHPPLAAPGECAYVRRSALELVGEGPGFAERCLSAGLVHVLADEVLVRGPEVDLKPASGEEADGPLARSLSRLRRTLRPTSVLIDARILGKPASGVQRHVVEVIAALADTGRLRVSALVPPRMGEEAAARLHQVPGVELLDHAGAAARAPFDVVHRPFQLSDPGELALLAPLGERLIVTHHDLIDYHSPAHFTSHQAWQGYRRLTRLALGAADRVVFCSAHVRGQALTEGLLEPDRAVVIPNGVDHALAPAPAPAGRAAPGGPPPPPPGHAGPTAASETEAGRPAALAAALPADAEVILCLGSDYRHKNRLFALRLLESLRSRHAWGGFLVLAGPRVALGSSRAEEAAWLASHPEAASAVLDLGPVAAGEKRWLLERAQLVLYPTLHEGFGLIPFEAAAHGAPCMWAPGTALSEVLPDAAATITAWDPAASADAAFELMRSDAARRRNLSAIEQAGARLTWQATAARLLEAYTAACDAAPTLAGALARRHQVLGGTVSEDALRLVGPGGRLPRDLERPLLAVATHRWIAAPLFAALRAGYRVSSRVNRWRAGGGGPRAQRRR